MTPLCCWDEQRRVLFVHAKNNAATVQVDTWHNAPRSVELVDPTPLHAEIASLRRELADGRDPYGEFPDFRGGVCGRAECQCADPGLPCREFMGIAETGPFCPCCGWNEAAHDRSRRRRAAKVERWLESRPVVGTVYQITAGVHAGRWDASCRGAHGVFRDHADAVRFADRMTRAESLRDADQDWREVAA